MALQAPIRNTNEVQATTTIGAPSSNDFYQFQRFPAELRYQVWLAAQEPREVRLYRKIHNWSPRVCDASGSGRKVI